jgi:hypothetical protein
MSSGASRRAVNRKILTIPRRFAGRDKALCQFLKYFHDVA